MSGIYIHIPFCHQACYYCDFHFSTSHKSKPDFLSALKKEIALQKDYLKGKAVNTVYFGGGTPSLLSKEEILDVFGELSKYFLIERTSEITLEANPDDLTPKKLKGLALTPINRLSIGVQSFSDKDLKFLNRVHTKDEAIRSVKYAQDTGFENITIDLIYGIQTLSNEQWQNNIGQAIDLNVPHVSCYSLTVEDKTPLASFIRKGKVKNIDPGKSAEQFSILADRMKENKFIHYEISNFCKEGYYSKHNSSYWKGEKYLGFGPSAHSYNLVSRQWNVSSNSGYINSLKGSVIPFEIEILSEKQRYNEYIMTSLRTMWGADLNYIEKSFPEYILLHIKKEIGKFIHQKTILLKDNKIFLTDKGKLFADKISSDLFFT